MMNNWCKGCTRNEDGYVHLKCSNCTWNMGRNMDGPFKWDRFVPKNDQAKHPSSYFAPQPKKNKKSGFWDLIVGFTKTFM